MNRARDRVLQLCYEDDNDEDDMLIFGVRRPRWIQERAQEFDDLDDHDFVTRYRLTKSTVLPVLEKIEESLEYKTDRSVNFVSVCTNERNMLGTSDYRYFIFYKSLELQ